MSVLDRIFSVKREEVVAARAEVSEAALLSQIRDVDPPRGFLKALQDCGYDLALIAEVKKASPSKGVIRADFDPVAIARGYEAAGAQALSVLTDVPHFQGAPEYLTAARRATKLPALRKDFLYDPYQVLQARAWGADAVLLIAASLTDRQIAELQAAAQELGMDALVEVHDEVETDRALALGCPLIGVNNRNLSNFETSLDVSRELLPKIAPHALAVSESALETRADLDVVQEAGANAVLIGTAFCAAPDLVAKVREVMGRTETPSEE